MFKIYCFQKEFNEKNNSEFETPKNSKSSKNSIFFVKKSVMKEYKEIFDYKTFYKIIKKSKIEFLKENGYFSYKNAYYNGCFKRFIQEIGKFSRFY